MPLLIQVWSKSIGKSEKKIGLIVSPIEGLPHEEKIEIIRAAYQTLRQKDGEIRNNLKLMDIRLADLIMPIKTAR